MKIDRNLSEILWFEKIFHVGAVYSGKTFINGC